MATIGRSDQTGTSSVGQGTATSARMNLASTIHTAVASETATMAYVYIASVETGSDTIDVYLYDITGQTATDPDGATLEATATITLSATPGLHSLAMSFALTEGNDYAVAVGKPSVSVNLLRETGLTSGDGASSAGALPVDPWAGSPSTNQYVAYIETTVAAGASITSIDDPVETEETGVTIVGTGFEAAQGTGGVTLGGIAVTETSWADTAVDITIPDIESTVLEYGTHTVELTNDSAESDTITTDVTPVAGEAEVILVAPLASSGDRITAIADLVADDQIVYNALLYENDETTVTAHTVTVNTDGTFTIGNGPVSDGTYKIIGLNAWDSGTPGWGTRTTQTVTFGDVGGASNNLIPLSISLAIGI